MRDLLSRSGGVLEAVPALGFLPGSLSVHSDGDPDRHRAYVRAVAGERLPPGCAADGSAALSFAGTELLTCVASRAGAGTRRVELIGRGAVSTPMPVELLDQAALSALPTPAISYHDRLALAELRALRLGRRPWG
jgi:hypothetical protein